ncbi:MAG: tRNA threonylcarbamoyladenosine dehydratase [Burkholderiaceae bacterium]|nr:tRNA threonylcarbamoyladenosine dehydratase [Burkholderiaceae bacterium]
MTLATALRTDVQVPADEEADLERRFGGLRRLYGEAGYRRLRSARVAVVGLGGVGSWAVEALARCGVAGLVLIDLDHVAESNINRQVQALGATVGQAKAVALQQRIADIHPGCQVQTIEDFAGADNWPALLVGPVDAVIDACDQGQAKLAIARWARETGVTLVVCGAAGGKVRPQAVEVADLAEVTHDPLLATLRQRLRKAGPPPQARGKGLARFGLDCVFSRESVAAPIDAACGADRDSSLNCHGYGSTVTVTATFGLVAANCVIERLRSAGAAAS